MDGSALTLGGAITLATLALTACGSGDDKPDQPPADRKAAQRAGLTKPIYPRCATEQLTKPRTREITSAETRGRAWSIEYSGRTQRPNAISTLLLVELTPAAPLPPNKPGVRNVQMGERRVAIKTPPTANVITAQWKTPRATYTTIIAGTRNQKRVQRLVACLP